MIRTAKTEDVNALKILYQKCFDDSSEYTDLVFSNLLEFGDVILYELDGDIASMMFMIPLKLRLDSSVVIDCNYIYAACTNPEYRSLGIMGKLLQGSSKLAVKIGQDISCLVPASESLFEYYGKKGYKNAFYQKQNVILSKNITKCNEKINLFAADVSHVFDIREQIIHRLDGALIHSTDSLKLTLADVRYAGGGVLLIPIDSGYMGYAIYYPNKQDGVIEIKEICIKPGDECEAMSLIHAHLQADKYNIVSHQNLDFSFGEQNVVLKGMAILGDEKDVSNKAYEFLSDGQPCGYINLIYD